MLSWVVKVVPQPPEPTPKRAEDQKEEKAAAPAAPPAPQEKKVTFQDEHKAEAQKADRAKQEAQVAEGNSTASGCQPGVLTWISGALPLPAVSPKVSRANSTAPEENTASRKGVMAWIAHGLEKVVPHPDLKSKECAAVEPPAEVCPAAAAPAEPQVLVVEVESDREDADNQRLPPRMIDWIKQGIEKVVPQPEIHVRAKADSNEKNEASAAAKAPPPQPPAAPKPAADTERSPKEAEQQPNMMGWIVSGIGRMLPQPVQKQDTGSDEVQTRGKCSKSPLK